MQTPIINRKWDQVLRKVCIIRSIHGELTIYRTGGEHSNNYATDAVVFSTKLVVKMENTVHNRKWTQSQMFFHYKIHPRVLVYYKANVIIITLKINLFSPWYSWTIAELALNNNHSVIH
jgi:hypothetical protein